MDGQRESGRKLYKEQQPLTPITLRFISPQECAFCNIRFLDDDYDDDPNYPKCPMASNERHFRDIESVQ